MSNVNLVGYGSEEAKAIAVAAGYTVVPYSNKGEWQITSLEGSIYTAQADSEHHAWRYAANEALRAVARSFDLSQPGSWTAMPESVRLALFKSHYGTLPELTEPLRYVHTTEGSPIDFYFTNGSHATRVELVYDRQAFCMVAARKITTSPGYEDHEDCSAAEIRELERAFSPKTGNPAYLASPREKGLITSERLPNWAWSQASTYQLELNISNNPVLAGATDRDIVQALQVCCDSGADGIFEVSNSSITFTRSLPDDFAFIQIVAQNTFHDDPDAESALAESALDDLSKVKYAAALQLASELTDGMDNRLAGTERALVTIIAGKLADGQASVVGPALKTNVNEILYGVPESQLQDDSHHNQATN